MQEIADHIYLCEEILNGEFCKKTIEKLQHVNWIEASKGKFVYDIDDNFDKQHTKMLTMLFLDKINDMLNVYRDLDRDRQIPILDESYVFGRGRMTKYHEGADFHCHFDSRGEHGKAITGIIYLNDDFEGGGLSYPHQDINHIAKTGDLVFHPSLYTHPHKSSTITKGTKYICVFMATLLKPDKELTFGNTY